MCFFFPTNLSLEVRKLQCIYTVTVMTLINTITIQWNLSAQTLPNSLIRY